MKQFFISFVIFSSLTAFGSVTLVEFGSKDGMQRFEKAKKADFAPLANNFESQINRLFCGPATSTIILNALRLKNEKKEKPIDKTLLLAGDTDHLEKDFNPLFNRYTQNNFFNANKVKARSDVFGKKINDKTDFGFQIRQLNDALMAHGLKTDLHIVTEKSNMDTIRKEIVKNLSEEGNFVIVNYHRPALGQKGGGHISPLAAYDAKTDSVLILDVNPNAAPWVWVKLSDLVAAMNTKDTIENRGYILVTDN